MAAEVRLTPAAAGQIEDAVRWWRANRSAAPELLEDELLRAVGLLEAQPQIGAPVDDPVFVGVRRLWLSRIGYHLYYRLRGERTVEVVALWHSRRRQGPPLSGPV